VHKTRRPGDTDTRIPVAEAGVIVVESAIGVAAGAGDNGFDGAGLQTEVHDMVVIFILWRVIFEPDAEV